MWLWVDSGVEWVMDDLLMICEIGWLYIQLYVVDVLFECVVCMFDEIVVKGDVIEDDVVWVLVVVGEVKVLMIEVVLFVGEKLFELVGM